MLKLIGFFNAVAIVTEHSTNSPSIDNLSLEADSLEEAELAAQQYAEEFGLTIHHLIWE